MSNSIPPPKMNSRHMPCMSFYTATPSQCLIINIIVIILIIIIIIVIILIIIIMIIIIIRLEIRIFRYPFSKYPTMRWKWQVRISIGTAKRDIGICGNTDPIFFPLVRCMYLIIYTSKWLFKWIKRWATMDIVGCSFFRIQIFPLCSECPSPCPP